MDKTWKCPYCPGDFASHAPTGECPGEVSPETRRMAIKVADLYAKERMEHPQLKDSQVWGVVADHLRGEGDEWAGELAAARGRFESVRGNPLFKPEDSADPRGHSTYKPEPGQWFWYPGWKETVIVIGVACKGGHVVIQRVGATADKLPGTPGYVDPERKLVHKSQLQLQNPCHGNQEDAPEPYCPQCEGGPADLLGTLGKLKHYRCRFCGWTFSDSEENPPSGRKCLETYPWGKRRKRDGSLFIEELDTRAHAEGMKENLEARSHGESYSIERSAAGWIVWRNPPRAMHRRIRPERMKPFSAKDPMKVVESPLVEQQKRLEATDVKTKLSKIGIWGVIPHSELAMHTGLAGLPVFQYLLVYGVYGKGAPTYAMVLTSGKKILDGLPGEVIPYEVREAGVRGNPLTEKDRAVVDRHLLRGIESAHKVGGPKSKDAEEIVEVFKKMPQVNPPGMTLIGRKVIIIEAGGRKLKGNFGAALGLKDGSAFIKGFFSEVPTGFVTAIWYLDEAKAGRMGLSPVDRPWKHDFSGLHVKARRCRGGILLKGDKPVWEMR